MRTSKQLFRHLLSDHDCWNVDDVILTLKDRLEFFKKPKEDGFRLIVTIDVPFVEFETLDSGDCYWV